MRMTLDDVARVICHYYQITPDNLKSRRRDRGLVIARGMYCVFATVKVKEATISKIGEVIDRHHSTVIHARKEIENLLYLEEIKRDVLELKQLFE